MSGPVGPFGGPTAVEQPVPQAERDDVGQPDGAAGGEQDRAGLLLVVVEDGARRVRRPRRCCRGSSRRRAPASGDAGASERRSMRPGSPTISTTSSSTSTTGAGSVGLQHVPVGERELQRCRHEHGERHRPATLALRRGRIAGAEIVRGRLPTFGLSHRSSHPHRHEAVDESIRVDEVGIVAVVGPDLDDCARHPPASHSAYPRPGSMPNRARYGVGRRRSRRARRRRRPRCRTRAR